MGMSGSDSLVRLQSQAGAPGSSEGSATRDPLPHSQWQLTFPKVSNVNDSQRVFPK